MAFIRQEYNKKYQTEKYDRITVNFPKGYKEQIEQAASIQRKSVSAFIIDCVNSAIGQCDRPTQAAKFPVQKDFDLHSELENLYYGFDAEAAPEDQDIYADRSKQLADDYTADPAAAVPADEETKLEEGFKRLEEYWRQQEEQARQTATLEDDGEVLPF